MASPLPRIIDRPQCKMAPEAYPFIVLGLIFACIALLVHPFLSLVFVGLAGFTAFFFRNPPRTPPLDANTIIAPADGRVIEVAKVEESRFLHKTCLKISIFMSPMNAHINRIPMTGKVVTVAYNPGKFLTAFHEKASMDNEQNALVMENKKGDRIVCVQIAGWLARRIVSYVTPPQIFKQGDIFGLIRFGSRVDVYFPQEYEVCVTLSQPVKAGESVLARWK